MITELNRNVFNFLVNPTRLESAHVTRLISVIFKIPAMTVLKGCNFQEQSIPFESLQPFINGRVNSERVATFQNIFFFPINTIQSSEYWLRIFLIFLLLKITYFFVYFPAVDWFADSRVFGIYTLLIKIIITLGGYIPNQTSDTRGE